MVPPTNMPYMDIYTVQGNYSSSWLSQFLHSWPHIAFTLELVPSYNYTFDNVQYLESLAVIALMAVIWLLVSMIFFAIYFCCFKGSSKPVSKYSSNGCFCSLCLLIIFIMLALAWVAVGAYGNLQANEGLKTSVEAVTRGSEIFDDISEKLTTLQGECSDLISASQKMTTTNTGADAMYLREYITKYSSVCGKIGSQTQGVNDRLHWAVDAISVVEKHRNVVTYALLGFQLLICLMAMMGLCCQSKTFLTLMIVFGILCITATYFHLGVDLLIDVASADFCINPYVFVQNETVQKNYMTMDAAMYYLECAYNSTNPFETLIQEGEVLVSETQQYIRENISNETTLLHLDEITNYLASAEVTLDQLSSAIDCRTTKRELVVFIPAVCEKSLEGLAMLTASMFAVAISMSLAMCAAAKVGKRYDNKKRKPDFHSNEEFSDPFLTSHPSNNSRNRPPQRTTMTTHTNNPLYGTSSSNFGAASNTMSIFRGSDDDVSTPLEQPPPYSPPRHDTRGYETP